MKKFAKKSLAIAVLMMAFGGVANMAHASNIINSQDVSADKTVKQGGAVKIEFTPSTEEIVSGVQPEDVAVFVLKVSDSAQHSGWRMVPTGSSEGGYMYNDTGNRVPLHSAAGWAWVSADNNWHIDDSSNKELEDHLYLTKGQVVQAGVYHYTGRVEEYL
ncbi:TPA: MyfA/PsaA family fimbrial adhesin [Yersinia enterocolitica]|nr:MyfA/PsaA family fimbrial adhesin [Yersinia enterocolitica]HDL7823578.1 MyfA/PsaA family fimbrial adhesin [Yersinia enterocolitica]HDL7831160.1 MyfA/PsaA family fimbrial adhesin [Yersinia enterocolitica]HDL7872024.1 MyfA/PsaA family fimbrial adhesin [Yersinia enterocolitica]HDL7884346.1 MyfA/PsaA family fimbrial adhesin [Yersinia enterocolitica]